MRELIERLREAVAKVGLAAPGEVTVYDANEGDGWPPRPLWCFKNEAYDSESNDGLALQGSVHYGGKGGADAISAAMNFLRDHGAEAAAALEAAREDGCVALVADIRFACGDNGKRMQPELVEFIRGLAADAERFRAAREAASAFLAVSFPPEFEGCPDDVKHAYRYWQRQMVAHFGAQGTDAAIDQARGKEQETKA